MNELKSVYLVDSKDIRFSYRCYGVNIATSLYVNVHVKDKIDSNKLADLYKNCH